MTQQSREGKSKKQHQSKQLELNSQSGTEGHAFICQGQATLSQGCSVQLFPEHILSPQISSVTLAEKNFNDCREGSDGGHLCAESSCMWGSCLQAGLQGLVLRGECQRAAGVAHDQGCLPHPISAYRCCYLMFDERFRKLPEAG